MKWNQISKCGWLVVLLCSGSICSSAQSFDFRPDPDFKKYLEDRKKTHAGNVVKVNPLAYLAGYASFSYERRIGNQFGLEFAYEHPLRPKHAARATNLRDVNPYLHDITGGYGYYFILKYYKLESAIDYGPAFGTMFRKRYFEDDVGSTHYFTEIGFHKSYQYLHYNRLILSFEYYFLWQIIDTKTDVIKSYTQDHQPVYETILFNSITSVIGFQAKLGYAF